MSVLRNNKVLSTDIVKQCFNLELLTYNLIDNWKKKYKYTLIEDLRKHVKELRECVICALRRDKNQIKEKLFYYDMSLYCLDNIEYLLEMMTQSSINVISNKQYADFAILVDDIGKSVDRLMHSLNKKNNENNERIPES
jgi:hypothetical protein